MCKAHSELVKKKQVGRQPHASHRCTTYERQLPVGLHHLHASESAALDTPPNRSIFLSRPPWPAGRVARLPFYFVWWVPLRQHGVNQCPGSRLAGSPCSLLLRASTRRHTRAVSCVTAASSRTQPPNPSLPTQRPRHPLTNSHLHPIPMHRRERAVPRASPSIVNQSVNRSGRGPRQQQ